MDCSTEHPALQKLLLFDDCRRTGPTELIKYQSVDSVVEVDDAVHYPVEFLHTLDPPRISSHVRYLKVGALIMLLRNLNPPNCAMPPGFK
ncbi:hypothetical protein AVEN_215684-1 [Araneus ventricosus]|uniref:DNA helicase Pif1-like 2B domain-containing protein n=1 Tax=Araneus ventricosus TaxID=182803 RepID=A0A4Y2MBF5_ARAVE|nr:hypothetical protein AVEN_215684-1 [Araneus ventricosus]